MDKVEENVPMIYVVLVQILHDVEKLYEDVSCSRHIPSKVTMMVPYILTEVAAIEIHNQDIVSVLLKGPMDSNGVFMFRDRNSIPKLVRDSKVILSFSRFLKFDSREDDLVVSRKLKIMC